MNLENMKRIFGCDIFEMPTLKLILVEVDTDRQRFTNRYIKKSASLDSIDESSDIFTDNKDEAEIISGIRDAKIISRKVFENSGERILVGPILAESQDDKIC